MEAEAQAATTAEVEAIFNKTIDTLEATSVALDESSANITKQSKKLVELKTVADKQIKEK